MNAGARRGCLARHGARLARPVIVTRFSSDLFDLKPGTRYNSYDNLISATPPLGGSAHSHLRARGNSALVVETKNLTRLQEGGAYTQSREA